MKKLKVFLNVIGKEMAVSLASFRFWGPMFAYLALLLLGSEPMILGSGAEQDIANVISNATSGGGSLFWLRFCLFVVPYGCCYYDEFAGSGTKYRLIRSSPGIYGTSKIVTGGLLTGALVLLANALFVVILKLQGLPLMLEDDLNGVMQTSQLAADGHVVELAVYLILVQCFAGIFFATLTIALSAFIRNKFLLLGMPVALFFGLDSFSGLFFNNGYTQPDITNWRILFFTLQVNGACDQERFAVVRSGLYVLVAACIFCVIFVRRVREVAEIE
ncbi:MAG: hypothetical protein LUE29_12890 [Lachnospiraceae bacterium]|nr:hypothetical protein [Lachnospiraceae bacterium]